MKDDRHSSAPGEPDAYEDTWLNAFDWRHALVGLVLLLVIAALEGPADPVEQARADVLACQMRARDEAPAGTRRDEALARCDQLRMRYVQQFGAAY